MEAYKQLGEGQVTCEKLRSFEAIEDSPKLPGSRHRAH